MLRLKTDNVRLPWPLGNGPPINYNPPSPTNSDYDFDGNLPRRFDLIASHKPRLTPDKRRPKRRRPDDDEGRAAAKMRRIAIREVVPMVTRTEKLYHIGTRGLYNLGSHVANWTKKQAFGAWLSFCREAAWAVDEKNQMEAELWRRRRVRRGRVKRSKPPREIKEAASPVHTTTKASRSSVNTILLPDYLVPAQPLYPLLPNNSDCTSYTGETTSATLLLDFLTTAHPKYTLLPSHSGHVPYVEDMTFDSPWLEYKESLSNVNYLIAIQNLDYLGYIVTKRIGLTNDALMEDLEQVSTLKGTGYEKLPPATRAFVREHAADWVFTPPPDDQVSKLASTAAPDTVELPYIVKNVFRESQVTPHVLPSPPSPFIAPSSAQEWPPSMWKSRRRGSWDSLYNISTKSSRCGDKYKDEDKVEVDAAAIKPPPGQRDLPPFSPSGLVSSMVVLPSDVPAPASAHDTTLDQRDQNWGHSILGPPKVRRLASTLPEPETPSQIYPSSPPSAQPERPSVSNPTHENGSATQTESPHVRFSSPLETRRVYHAEINRCLSPVPLPKDEVLERCLVQMWESHKIGETWELE